MKESLKNPVERLALVPKVAPGSPTSPASPAPAATPESPEAWLDRVLDERYRVLRVLGEGGMGAVFVAEQLALHKLVALKIVRSELKTDRSEVAVRLAREAMATARLEHPHIASALDYGALPEGGAYFVMQLVRGTSLRRMLAGGRRLPWARACEIAAQVADALSATRAAGIVHRDLKPDNILVEVREDGSDLVKVLDFGIAQVAPRLSVPPAGAEPDRQITVSGTVMGTPGYMAPEQAVGDKVDHRADLYALGVVLWECIAGRELWVGPDLTSMVSSQMSERVPLLRNMDLDPELPPQLDELIQSLTERLASARPEHPAQVRDALRRMTRAYPLVSASPMPANAQMDGGHSRGPRLSRARQPGELGERGRRRSRSASGGNAGTSFWFAALALAALYLTVRTFFPQLLQRDRVAAAQDSHAAITAPAAPPAERVSIAPLMSESSACSFDAGQPPAVVAIETPAPVEVRRAPRRKPSVPRTAATLPAPTSAAAPVAAPATDTVSTAPPTPAS